MSTGKIPVTNMPSGTDPHISHCERLLTLSILATARLVYNQRWISNDTPQGSDSHKDTLDWAKLFEIPEPLRNSQLSTNHIRLDQYQQKHWHIGINPSPLHTSFLLSDWRGLKR
jgi:hypothetical protein